MDLCLIPEHGWVALLEYQLLIGKHRGPCLTVVNRPQESHSPGFASVTHSKHLKYFSFVNIFCFYYQ